MKKVLIFIFLIFTCFLASRVLATGTVNINTATLAQLDTLTGIGPKYAQAIIDARPFSSVDDLLKVKGIGPKTLQKIKDQGLAYVAGQTNQAPQVPATAKNVTVVNNTTTVETATAEPNGATSEQAKGITQTTYPTGVIINEILPNPAGPDETDEWFELYNSNTSAIDLSSWQIQDTVGTATTYTIPAGIKISANAFLVFKRPDTKIMLNNDQDGVNLLTPDGKIIDAANFTKAPLNQPYNKTSSGWQWSTTPTPGAKNIITATTKTPSTGSGSNVLPKAQKSANNGNIKAEDLTAGLSQPISATASPWPMFLIVFGSTIILAIIVLLIKLKVLKNYVRT